jgi:TonB family protein
MNEKKYLKAVPILNSVLKDSPTSAEFWFKYGECQRALQDNHEALAAFEMTKKLAPDFAGVSMAVEEVKKRIRDEQVRKSSESVAAAERQREEERIATLISAGSYRDAADSSEKMLAAFPVNAKGWFYLGVCRQALSEFHAALAAYEMSLRLSRTNSEVGNVVSQLRAFFQEQGQPGAVPPALPLEVNLEPYFADLQSRITRAWFPPRISSDRQTTVSFFVHHDGTMVQLQLVSSSGLAIFDQAALKAIEAAAPFRPLPCAFGPIGGIRIEARFHRFANLSSEWTSNLTLKRVM